MAKRKQFPQGVLLGEPPVDRPLKHGELLTWNGQRYQFLWEEMHPWVGLPIPETGIYEFDAYGERGEFVGACRTLFEAEAIIREAS